jgi:hypothetical protein
MKETRTHWRKLTNPKFLGTYSLAEGQELVLTIKEVKMEITESARGKEESAICYFKENVKPMFLNVTNSKTLEKMYGSPMVELWEGRKLTVYSAPTKVKGVATTGLRIRTIEPKEHVKQVFNTQSPGWEKAEAAIKSGSTTVANIEKHYTLTDATKKILNDLTPKK